MVKSKIYNPNYLPQALTDLEKLAINHNDTVANYSRRGRNPEHEFEKKIWFAFRNLDFRLDELGHKRPGRHPDGIAYENENRCAIIFDGKMREGGYSIQTDDRVIKDYMEKLTPKLRSTGFDNHYYVIISSFFRGKNSQKIDEITQRTSLKNVILMKAELLLYLVQLKLCYSSPLTASQIVGILHRSKVELSPNLINNEIRPLLKGFKPSLPLTF